MPQRAVRRAGSSADRGTGLGAGRALARTLAVLLSTAVPVQLGRAQTASPSPAVKLVPLVVPLTLDQRLLGDIGIEVDATGSTALVDGKRLIELFAKPLGPEALARLETLVARREQVPLAELKLDGLSLELDMSALVLRAEVTGAARTRQSISFRGLEPPDPTEFDAQADYVGGIEINLFQGISSSGNDVRFRPDPLDAIIQGYVTIGGFEGVTLTYGVDTVDSFRDVRVPDVTLIHDRFDNAIRLQAGEVSPRLIGFQGAGDLLGIGIERRYTDIRPFQNIRSSGRRQIILERPSIVEFFVNGVSVGERELAPGPYNVEELPLVQGANNVRLIIEDPTGRRELVDFSTLFAPTLLGEGIVDFGAWAGYATAGDLERSGDPIATGFVLAGITSGLTLGANVQAGNGVAQGGATVATGFGDTLASVNIAYARNRRLGLDDWALAFDLRQTASVVGPDDLTITGVLERRGADFTSVGVPLLSNPESWRAGVAAALQLPNGLGFNFGGTYTRGRAASPDFATVTGSVFARVGAALLSLTGSYEASGSRSDTRAQLGVSVPLGQRWTASARGDVLGAEREVALSRYLGSGLREVGASFRATRDRDRDTLDAQVEYAGQRVELELRHRVTDPNDRALRTSHTTFWRASTFIGFADGLLGFGREGPDGFALVRRHPTLDQAQLTLTNGGRVVGETDGWGTLLVPVERAYPETRATVAVDPLPLGYDIGSGAIRLFPGFGAGYDITIGSDASYTVIGNFTNRQGEPLTLIVGELRGPELPAPAQFFTNASGRFVANKVAPGDYEVVVRGRTVGKLSVQAGEDALVQVGTIALNLE